MRRLLLAGFFVAGAALFTPASPAQAQAPGGCSAYTYVGTATTICDRFPGAADRDCPQLNGTVKVRTSGVDPWRLDRDGDGTGCDGAALTPAAAAPGEPAPATSSPAAPGAATLPKTGPGMPVLVGGAAVAAGAGALLLLSRRRKITFSA